MSSSSTAAAVEVSGRRWPVDPETGFSQRFTYERIEDAPVLHRTICREFIRAHGSPTNNQVARNVGCSEYVVNAVRTYRVCRDHIERQREAFKDEMLRLADQMDSLFPKAIAVFDECMAENMPPTIRLKAANSVLDRDPEGRLIRETRSKAFNVNQNLGPESAAEHAYEEARKNYKKRRAEVIDVKASEVSQ